MSPFDMPDARNGRLCTRFRRRRPSPAEGRGTVTALGDPT
jgi:hypothetical protein